MDELQKEIQELKRDRQPIGSMRSSFSHFLGWFGLINLVLVTPLALYGLTVAMRAIEARVDALMLCQ